jgi:hypothetical protein
MNLHYREWMLFVDGENLTIRGQKLAASNQLDLLEGPNYRKDCFFWFRGSPAITARFQVSNRLRESALRAYFYTSVVGDDSVLNSVRNQIRDLGFNPEVFKRDADQKKAKGVDIALTKDMLSH